MEREFLIPLFYSSVGIAATVALEHLALSRLWARYELARRAMGIGTVLFWVLLGALMGAWDMATVIVIASAFIIAGIVLGGMVTCERAKVQQRAERDLSDGANGRSGPELPG